MTHEKPECRDCVEWRADKYTDESGLCYLYPRRPQFRNANDSCPEHTANLLEYMSSPEEESEDHRSGPGQPERFDLGRNGQPAQRL